MSMKLDFHFNKKWQLIQKHLNKLYVVLDEIYQGKRDKNQKIY